MLFDYRSDLPIHEYDFSRMTAATRVSRICYASLTPDFVSTIVLS